MGSHPTPRPPRSTPAAAPLAQTLDQSKQVEKKVEQAGVDLASVNASLKVEIAEVPPLAKLEGALVQSEAVETKVLEAAAELVAVNDALAEEIDERHHLESELEDSETALAESRTNERAARASTLHDPSTGLPNLTLFNDRLRVALAQAERHDWRLAVLFIDLDAFKVINDTHGHDAGDRVLQIVAERMQSSVRASDTVARRSGDEFLVLMLEVENDADVRAFAAKIAGAIAEPCDVGGVRLTVAASIGIALYPTDGRAAPALLKNADIAMYAAKQRKVGPVFFSGLLRS